jgi:hypothetical protein
MGADTRIIAGVRTCHTFVPGQSSPTIQPTPHFAEALAPQGPSRRGPLDEASNRGPAAKCGGDFATTIVAMLVLLGYRRSTYSMAT